MRIAALDDELSQAQLIKHVLAAAGHDCHVFTDGRSLMRELRRESYDLLVLDWIMPDIGGLHIVKWARESIEDRLPILFLADQADEAGILEGLRAGADDYMVKPVRRAELRARVNALLSRTYPEPVCDQLVCGTYCFDLSLRQLRVSGKHVDLTQKEYELSVFLFRNMGRLLSRRHLLEAVWGRDLDIPSRTIDTHISRLRTKLSLRPESGFRLTPVYSLGYRFETVPIEPAAELTMAEATAA